MIFLMGVVGIWIGFSDDPQERLRIVIAIGCIFGCNFFISLTPCYTNHKYEKHRVVLNVFTVLSLLSVGFVWVF